jgi:hypothetical protein
LSPFRSVQGDESLLQVCRYVERNALSDGEVQRAEDWPRSSLWVREHGTVEQSRWELSLTRSRPFGDDRWTAKAVAKLGLEDTVREEDGEHRKREA